MKKTIFLATCMAAFTAISGCSYKAVQDGEPISVVVCTLMVAAAVAAAGTIAWVGLIVPHIGRYLAGTDHSNTWCSEPISASSVSPETLIARGASA